MKRLLALALALALLAGCAAGSEPIAPATLPPAPAAAPQVLTVANYLGSTDTDNAADRALAAYAQAMGVQLTVTHDAPADAPGTHLALLYAPPADDGTYRDLAADPLLAAAAARAGLDTSGPVLAFPLGRTLYACWADSALLTALLGEGCLADLQNASWEEWKAFAEAVTAWLAAPAETTLTLNAQPYTLPAQKPAEAAALAGVFALPAEQARTAGGGAPYTVPLLAAGAARNAQTLTGPLNGLASAFLLEQANAAPDADTAAAAVAALAGGRALFCRMPLCDLLANLPDDSPLRERLVPLPFKGNYVQSDLSNPEYNLTGLLNYPTLASAGYLAIPAGIDEAGYQAAAALLLWLYGSAAGEDVLIDDLLLITPWDTAADTTVLGALQVRLVGAGILPGAVLTAAQTAELAAAWRDLTGRGAQDAAGDRAAFSAAALAVLAPPDA